MRALTISAHGGLERLEVRDDLPEPEIAAPGDVKIRVHAGALNHLDLWVLRGIPGVSVSPGWIMGGDAAGVVEAVGDEVRHVKPGDHVVVNPGISCRQCEYCLDGEHSLCVRFRLLGEHLPGSLAERIVVPGVNVRAIPRDLPWDRAAAFTLATLTAWRMITTRARVRAGEDVLIWGIGGGVALAALQICRNLGARTWVTSSSDAKLERARALGADVLLNHRALDVGKEVRARTGKRGVDVVVDSVGEATWAQSLGALGKRGRLVTCGGTSGAMVQTDVRRLFWNQWSLLGSTMGNDRELDEIMMELEGGRLVPPVDSVHPLERGREAFARLASGEQFGKVVVSVTP